MSIHVHVVQRPAISLVGVVARGLRPDFTDEITDLWSLFISRAGEIRPDHDTITAFGVSRAGAIDGEFDYMAGVLDAGGDVPEGMDAWVIPAGPFASVEALGLPDIKKKIGWFFGEWAPHSTFAPTGEWLVEEYPVAFRHDSKLQLFFSGHPRLH